MKYLIVIDHGLELAVLFDEILTHSEVAKSFSRVVSAGKCNAKGVAYGHSVSMKLTSRPEDTGIISDSINRTI